MKKMILTLVVLLSMTAVQAQESDNNQQRRGPKKMTPAELTDRMAENLKLTDEQKTKVLKLNEEYEKVVGGPAIRPRRQMADGESGATAKEGQQRPERPQLTDAQKEEMKKNFEQRKEYEQKLKEILTEDQYKQYQQSRQRRPGRMGRPGRGGRPGGPRPQF